MIHTAITPPHHSHVTRLNRAGADLVLADLPDRRSDVEAVAKQVEGLGRSALALSVDVRDRGSVDAAFKEVAK